MTIAATIAEKPAGAAPLWLLALITFSGTLAMHIFVPALPEAGHDLGASIGAMQMTMSVYIFGLAIGQLLYGPLSDRFGRRSILTTGLVIYAATGLWAAFAPDVHTLIILRLLQALGGCSGLVIGRAIVRDTALAKEAARRLALMNLMVAIGPGAAPLLGSALTTTFGWRSIFFALAGLGAVNLLFTWLLLPETHSTSGTAQVGRLARNYGRLLRSPAFLGYALGGGCATTSIYGFIAASPFIFIHQLGRPDYEVGIYLAIQISGIWLGSMAASRLIPKVSVDRLMVGANLASVLAALSFLAIVLLGHLSVPLVVGPMFFFALGAGIASPAALGQAISVNPAVIGSASGLYGFSQMAVGAVCTAITGFGSNPALAAAIVLAAAGLVAQCSFWIALRFRGPTAGAD
ncbi:multidrug effflux MFS transporter [Reyranella sp.]|jgi:DHA1 family bicyclomycin/chloramphenicol resistance-like MFS transporter|uniref:multidrug effflux MFS transporter n=1 Tax=Reyranella sp. TaxID=1929291 RepID=UPI002F932DAE